MVREQWWAGKDGVSCLGPWYLLSSGGGIAMAQPKAVLGAEPAVLGKHSSPVLCTAPAVLPHTLLHWKQHHYKTRGFCISNVQNPF